jgi:hypothetical protein
MKKTVVGMLAMSQEDLLRALRRLPRRAAQGRHRQEPRAALVQEGQGRQRDRRRHAQAGPERLEKIIGYGTEGGMVNFDDILTKEEIALMARTSRTPGCAARVQLQGHEGFLEAAVPVDQRPTKQMNKST